MVRIVASVVAIMALPLAACSSALGQPADASADSTPLVDSGVGSGIDALDSNRPASDSSAADGSAVDSFRPDTGASAGIKWHPGHYLSSNVFTTLGNIDGSGNPAGPEKAAEIAVVRNGPTDVQGWEGFRRVGDRERE